jgi:preprotein translocase subunit SecG
METLERISWLCTTLILCAIIALFIITDKEKTVIIKESNKQILSLTKDSVKTHKYLRNCTELKNYNIVADVIE